MIQALLAWDERAIRSRATVDALTRCWLAMLPMLLPRARPPPQPDRLVVLLARTACHPLRFGGQVARGGRHSAAEPLTWRTRSATVASMRLNSDVVRPISSSLATFRRR